MAKKIHVGEPVNFIGVTYRNMEVELFTEKTWLKDNAIPKASLGDKLTKAGSLEHTAQRTGSSTHESLASGFAEMLEN